MGVRKRKSAEVRKEANKATFFAKLIDCPSSPRKMRLVADLVRGKDVEQALAILKHSPKDASEDVYKLLLSTIANWQSKNQGARIEDAHLYVSEIFVDSARQLKRIRTAPQGRAHRIRKRSNHVTLKIDSRTIVNSEVTNQ